MTQKQMRQTALPALLLILALSGCMTTQTRRHSSVVEYLYPEGTKVAQPAKNSVLSLPLDIGVAFVPAKEDRWRHELSQQQKTELMRDVSSQFEALDFVKSIQIIPTIYLKPGGGFTNVDQIGTIYGLDVIALISYDQTQFIEEGVGSLANWTLVGSYVVPGQKHDTHTMVDLAVYDIKSRIFLFRAPGTSQVKGRATEAYGDIKTRKDSVEGFEQACEMLKTNLDTELLAFRERVKEGGTSVSLAYKDGYTGAGSIDALVAAMALGFGALQWRKRKGQRA